MNQNCKKMSFINNLKLTYRNIPGWRTKRRIVVIESDDWGSIRMKSKDTYDYLLQKGLSVDHSSFTKYDGLESNEDLEMLFEVLARYKDSTDRHPVLTPACVVANPDFGKIKANGFTKYEYEPFTRTSERCLAHNLVHKLWLKGIKNRLFVPVFHGREHLNVQRWMRILQSGNKAMLLAFDSEVFGLSKGSNNEIIPEHLAAFDIELMADNAYLKEVIQTGTELFEELCGYRARYFVPPNSPGNSEIESTLKDCGIDFINNGRMQLEPLGNGRYKRKFHWLGKHNKTGQIHLIRNCFFEPVIDDPAGKDWVKDCLQEIEVAFRWHKPAIISTHRVNYVGTINPVNRAKGLNALDLFLKKIILKWPDVEFMTSVELGDLIKESKK
jgi:hypothetical protein